MSEKNEIKRDGSRAVSNSGRGIFKGDAILEPFLIDYKEYDETFGVSRKVWAKISSDAFRNGRREPALKLVLGKSSKVRLFVVEEGMFMEMLEAWQEANG